MAAKKAEKKSATLTKSALVKAVVDHVGDVSRTQVKSIFESLASIGYRELKKTGTFTVPGFAKFRVVKKPATKAREGVNPFTKERMTFAAKPASKAVRARPVKAAKDALV